MSDNISAITHVIFDLDGTLVNSEPSAYKVMQFITRRLGYELTPAIIDSIPSICCANDANRILRSELNVADEAIDRARHEWLAAIRGKVELMPGVERLVRHLKSHGVPMAIATANRERNFGYITEGLTHLLEPGGDYISHAVFGYDDPEVANNKPSPDVYLVCVDRFAGRPSGRRNVLVVEDNYGCARGAADAGMTTLLVTSDFGKSESRFVGVDFVVKSLEELKPESVGLPAYC